MVTGIFKPIILLAMSNFRIKLSLFLNYFVFAILLNSVGILIQKSIKAQTPREQESQVAMLKGLAQGLRYRKNKLSVSETEQQMLLNTFFNSPSDGLRKSALQFIHASEIESGTLRSAALGRAVTIAKDTSLSDTKRADAIDFLTIGNPSDYQSMLQSLLTPQEQPAVK